MDAVLTTECLFRPALLSELTAPLSNFWQSTLWSAHRLQPQQGLYSLRGDHPIRWQCCLIYINFCTNVVAEHYPAYVLNMHVAPRLRAILVSFPDAFSLSGGKYVWWSAYSILVPVRWDVGVLFHFNLTRDVLRITSGIRNSSTCKPAVKNKLSRTWMLTGQFELLVWASLSVPTGRGKSLCYAILSYVQTNRDLKESAFSISVLSWTLQSSKTKRHSHT